MEKGPRYLLGVTGSGKTFTMAQVIARTQKTRTNPCTKQNISGSALIQNSKTSISRKCG